VFQELMPLLGQRILILTLSRTNVDEICVNVIPKPIKPVEKDESVVITTPLSLTGSPEELDRDLPRQLVEFVGAHLELSTTLQTAKEEMASAAKAARDAAKKSPSAKTSALSPPAACCVANKGSAHSTLDTSGTAAEVSSAPGTTTGSLFESVSRVEHEG
jgi:PRTRC genetic system protein E